MRESQRSYSEWRRVYFSDTYIASFGFRNKLPTLNSKNALFENEGG